MKARLLLIAVVVVLAVSSSIGWAIGGRRIGNPIGPPTVPPSSYSTSGSLRSPNPIDSSGNLIITGNVANGKHFRGTVPYQGATSFQGEPGSTSLDSFLRRSAGSQNFRSPTSGYKPYYSPLGTITTTRPGRSGVFRPGTSTVGPAGLLGKREAAGPRSEIPVEGYTATVGPKEQALFNLGARTGDVRFRPRAISPQDLERLLTEGVGTRSQAKGLIREQNLGQMEQLRRDLEELRNRSSYLRESLTQREDRLELSSKAEPPALPQHFVPPSLPQIKGLPKIPESKAPTLHERAKETTTAKTRAELTELRQQEQLDIYEQMQQEIEDLRKSIEELRTGLQTEQPDAEKEEPEEQKLLPEIPGTSSDLQTDLEKSLHKSRDSVLGVPDTLAKARESLLKDQKSLFGTPMPGIRSQGTTSASSILERPATISRRPAKLAGPDVSAKAKSILGPYTTFEAYSKDKFSRHIVTAEVYMQQGRYYRAADSYAMAGIYKPGDPLAYIGRSHALFAAGEYMSSTLFLSRALEVAPELPMYSKSPDAVPAEYVGFKIGLTALIDDRDTLETRAADVEQWLKTSGAPELQLLLGYVYHQMGRTQRAKEAINAAYQKMPESSAVQALKKTIEGGGVLR